MIQVSEESLVIRYVVALIVGALLGAWLYSSWIYEDCDMEGGGKGSIEIYGKTFYCSGRYGDTIDLINLNELSKELNN